MTKNVRETGDASVILNSFRKSNNMSGAISDQIKWIKSTGAKLDAVIHASAVGCIYMSMPLDEGGFLNADMAARLLNSMPKGSRVKALAAWFEAFSNVFPKRDKNGEWACGLIKPTDKRYKAADPTTAFAKPFYSVEEKNTDPKAFILGEQLARLIKLASKPETMADMSEDERAFLAELTAVAAKAPKKPAAPVTDAPKAADPLENVG